MKQAVLVAILVVACSISAFGQATGSWRVGVGAEGGIPIGDFSNFASLGIGGIVKASYVVDPTFEVTLKTGYLSFSGKDITVTFLGVSTTVSGGSAGIIPILVGGKYYFMPGDTRVYGDAEVGMFSISNGGGTKFGFAPALGAEFKAGDKMWVDVHGNYSYISTDVISTSFIGFGVGLVFDLQ